MTDPQLSRREALVAALAAILLLVAVLTANWVLR